MKYSFKIAAGFAILIVSLLSGCGDTPLLTDMGTNRLMIVLKGTYESNSPMDWDMPDPLDADYISLMFGDSVEDCRDITSNPSMFLLDIAELKLVDSNGDSHRFSNYRQTFSIFLSDADPFFNGLGVVLDNDDVPSQKYPYPAVSLYIRKMLMDGAVRFEPGVTGWNPIPVFDAFSDHVVPSFNFNKFQIHSFYDTLRLESTMLNRVFPLVVPIFDLEGHQLGMLFDKKPPLTVLEIRIVVKNFIKMYEYETYQGGLVNPVHYFALSDWLQNVEANETNIGGNILAVARSYIPGLTGRISGSNGGGNDSHIIAIPAGADINSYTINTVPASNLRSDNDCNLPKVPPPYLGTSITQALDYYIKLESFKTKWNASVPAPCVDFDMYKQEWDIFRGEVGSGGFRLPQLAVFAPAGGSFTIENVPPGNYDLYRSNVAPRYGGLYYDGEYSPYGANPVTVGIGSTTTGVIF